MIPLYIQPSTFDQTANRGLWWDCFCPSLGNDAATVKAKFIAEIGRKECGDKHAIEKAVARQQALVAALGGRCIEATLDTPFVTGLGISHPMENGFAWHRTLGTPYLAGSGVKGMTRGWIDMVGPVHSHHPRLNDWFGERDAGNAPAGWYVFFDALPTASVNLRPEVLTPHRGKWYAEGGGDHSDAAETVPADWHDPVPVPFLGVDKGNRFLFSVAVRTNLPARDQANAEAQLEAVVEVLCEALREAGAGAKTFSGWGRMTAHATACDEK